MKALFFLDEIHQFHWSMLKSILLILSLLPLSQGILAIWQMSDATSQIMVGFIALSLFSALLILSFYSALKATVLKVVVEEQISNFEQTVVSIYRYVPMLSLAVMVSYLIATL
ncbi:hypothetical protein [Acinetobacter guerrae]|uniref:hypothetical protein n=1 Tax=Acinetobacter guerrae TaxID=1843371 RepID=UPI00125FBD86|nr:hypothetical protein [Acinetobacter guerrae]